MNSIGGEGPQEGDGGPMWSRFFDSFANQDDNESVMSGSHIPTDTTPAFPISPSRGGIIHESSHSEVHPNDSASAINEPSAVALPSTLGGSIKGAPVPVDDGTYVFKFRTPSGRTHRFQARNDNYDNIVDIVAGKLQTDPFFISIDGDTSASVPDPTDFTLSYTDSDGDTVLITSDSDVADAVHIARNAGSDRVVLFLQGGRGWDEAGAGESEKKARQASLAAAAAEEEVLKGETTSSSAVPDISISAPVPAQSYSFPSAGTDDDLFGIPRDLILPASLGFLGVVIIGVFIASRMSRDY
jgi:PB1 domain